MGEVSMIPVDRAFISELSKTRSVALKRVKAEAFLASSKSFEGKLGTFLWDSTRLQRVCFIAKLGDIAVECIAKVYPDDELPKELVTFFRQYYLLESSVNMNELLAVTNSVREAVTKKREACTTPFLNKQINVWLSYVVLESIADVLEGGLLNNAESMYLIVTSLLNILRVNELFDLEKNTWGRIEAFQNQILKQIFECWK